VKYLRLTEMLADDHQADRFIVVPQGTEIAGWPVMSNGQVLFSIFQLSVRISIPDVSQRESLFAPTRDSRPRKAIVEPVSV
jgi:hypothetical protein